MASATEMVRLEHCSKSYGETSALADVSLSVAEGEFVTLLGPSGSGKTTILNLIAGMIQPTAGRIHIAGNDVTETPVEKRGLGMVFQNYALMPHMTIYENIAFPLRVRRMGEDEIRRKVGEVLELVRLPGVEKRKPRQLSGGQQQRISLARCLVYNPPLILMDEPLGALDKKLREQMQLEIRRLQTELGVTMIYVTHDQEEALTMSDRIMLVNGGRIEQHGTPDDMYHRPRTIFAADFLGEANLFAAVVEAAGPPVHLSTPAGDRLTAAHGTGVAAGGSVKAMVRPENLQIVGAGTGSGWANTLPATAMESALLGSFIKHFARLRDGTVVTSRQMNTRDRTPIRPGDAVDVVFAADDCLVLSA